MNLDFKRPEPSGGIEYFKNELDKCLRSDEFKKNNYEKYLLSKNKWTEYCDYEPVRIDIENVSRCNYRCQMCQVSDWDSGKRAEDLSFDDFKQIIDNLKGLVEVKLQGMGEPTLGRNTYINMIKYLRSKHIWVRTVTNASLLHKSNFYKKLIDSDVNEIQISVDAADKKTFEKIRKKSVFERVVNNCKLINSYCEYKGIERTKMWVVVQKDNLNQLFDLLDLAKEMKFKHVVFTLDITGFGSNDVFSRNKKFIIDKSIDPTLLNNLVLKGEECGIKVSVWNTSSKYSTDNIETICPEPFERPYISSDKKVVPCCIIANPDTYNLGSSEYFSDIWNGKELKNFRKCHLDGNIPPVCKACYKI